MDIETNSINKVNPTNEPINDYSANNVIREGKAEIFTSSANKVFYNPVQEFNRDLRFVYK